MRSNHNKFQSLKFNQPSSPPSYDSRVITKKFKSYRGKTASHSAHLRLKSMPKTLTAARQREKLKRRNLLKSAKPQIRVTQPQTPGSQTSLEQAPSITLNNSNLKSMKSIRKSQVSNSKNTTRSKSTRSIMVSHQSLEEKDNQLTAPHNPYSKPKSKRDLSQKRKAPNQKSQGKIIQFNNPSSFDAKSACQLTKFWSNLLPIRKIDKHSASLTYKESDFKIKRNNALKSGLGYSWFKAKNKKTGKRVMIKVYQKSQIDQNSLKKCVETEILVHENLKQSRNILSMVATFESQTELFIVYQNFAGFVDLNSLARTDLEQKCILSQVLLGLMEINSYGYSVGYIDTNNLVKINNFDYRIFDLNYLTQHQKYIKNIQIRNEIGIKPPELALGRVFSRSDVWSFGIFMLMIFQKSRNLDTSKAKLLRNSRKEIMNLLRHKQEKRKITDLLYTMLREELDERTNFVEIIKYPYFSEFLKHNKDLYSRVYPKFEEALRKGIENLTHLEYERIDLNNNFINSRSKSVRTRPQNQQPANVSNRRFVNPPNSQSYRQRATSNRLSGSKFTTSKNLSSNSSSVENSNNFTSSSSKKGLQSTRLQGKFLRRDVNSNDNCYPSIVEETYDIVSKTKEMLDSQKRNKSQRFLRGAPPKRRNFETKEKKGFFGKFLGLLGCYEEKR